MPGLTIRGQGRFRPTEGLPLKIFDNNGEDLKNER